MRAINDLRGQRFTHLLVIELVGSDNSYRKIWRCLCDCGNVTDVRGASLLSENTHSCGCLRWGNSGGGCVATHGHTRRNDGKRFTSRTYQSWDNMKSRCINPNVPNYERY